MSFASKLGSSLKGGIKAVGHAHVAVGKTVAEGAGSAYSAVVDAKGDSGSRCILTLKEAAAYNEQLKHVEKNVKDMLAAVEATIEGSRGVLESPLPRVYDVPEGGGGGGATSEPVTPAGGHGFNGSTMVQTGVDLAQKLQTEVFGPLTHWHTAFKEAETRQKQVNKLFSEQEAARKKVDTLKSKLAELSSRTDADSQKKRSEVASQLAQAEAALSVAASRHASEEAEQHAKLVPLVQDAVQLKAWVKSALSLVSAALAAAAAAVPVEAAGAGAVATPEAGVQTLSLDEP